MKNRLLLFLLLMLSVGQLLYAQMRYEEDYKFPAQGNHYWTDFDVRNYSWEGMKGSMSLYTNDIGNCYAPLIIDLHNWYVTKFPVWDYGFYTDVTNVSEKTFKDYCDWWGSSLRLEPYWQYWALWVRLNNCTFGTYLKVKHHLPNYAPFIFSGINSLVEAEVSFGDDPSYTGDRIVQKSMFQDCRNLKFVDFKESTLKNGAFKDRIVYEQDIFLGCTSLEVVRFGNPPPDNNTWGHELYKIFHSNFDATGDNSPNMKAFVVPDSDIVTWTYLLRKVHRGVDEGWVKIIPNSMFKTRPKSVTLDSASLKLPNPGSTHQLTATVSPANVYSSNIIWSSSDTLIATVSSTGLVTSKNFGSATITAALEMDNRFTASCEVEVVYVHTAGVTIDTSFIVLPTLGSTYQLTATVSPSNAYNKVVWWSSSNPSVIDVPLLTGLVTAKSLGVATITVITEDGHTAVCTVASGNYCGDNARWTLVDSVLTISGSGATYDFGTTSLPLFGRDEPYDAELFVATPWYPLRLAINKIVIEPGITSIGFPAFAGLQNVRELVWHDGITRMANSAFFHCEKLKELKIPDNFTFLSDEAFYALKSIKRITIPPKVTEIGIRTFQKCTSATVLDISANVNSIGQHAFRYCTELTTVINRRPNPLSIPAYVFDGIDLSQSTLYVPPGTVDAYRTAGVWKDFGVITDSTVYDGFAWYLKDSVLTVRGGPRMLNYNSKDMQWYNNRLSIKKVIVDGFPNIGQSAFQTCPHLTSVTLPDSVEYIGDAAFGQDYRLNTVTCKTIIPPVVYGNPFTDINRNNVTLIVPASAVNAYSTHSYWKHFNIKTFVSFVTLAGTANAVQTEQTVQLTGNVLPANAYDRTINWSSSDTGIATVDQNGIVTGVAEGNATIIATSHGKNVSGESVTGVYSVRVLPSTSTVLQEATVAVSRSGELIDFDFDPLTDYYTVPVEENIREVTIEITPESRYATVTGPVSKYLRLDTGDNIFKVTVTAQDKIHQKTYTFNIKRNDFNFSGITVNASVWKGNRPVNSTLPLSFDPSQSYYNMDVSYLTTGVNISAKADSPEYGIDGTGFFPLAYGDNVFNIRLTNNYDIEKTYTVHIKRDDLYLSGIILSASVWEGTHLVNAPLSIPFAPSKLDYNLDVSYLTAEVNISVEADPLQTWIDGTGTFPLAYGENVFNIHLTDDYGRKTTYTLKINRSLNSYNQLQSLNCYPHSISPAYTQDIYDYTLNVEKTVDSIHINAVPVPPATLSGHTGVQRLIYGRNRFSFWVTAMDGGISAYTLEVWREPLDTDAALSYFAVDPGYLSPSFDPEITSYTAEVDSSVEEITIEAELRSPTAKFVPDYENPSTYPVKTGKNSFNFNVSTENSLSTNRYTLTVTRKGNTTNTARITRNIPAVGIRNGTIEINTPAAERMNIYAVTGTLLYSFDKPAGAFTLHPSPFHPFTLHRY